MKIKVCGMREPENIRAVEQLNIDWLGFIFYSPSPRCFSMHTDNIEAVRKCKKKKVGVFVNADPADVLAKITELQLDYIQLHGNETPESCFQLQKRGCQIIKVFAIENKEDLLLTNAYAGYADYFLFDTKTTAYGGSGKRFDWNVLQTYEGKTPFLLSGGISPESLDDLLAFHHPQMVGIDLNSGFEHTPGIKDPFKLEQFIRRLEDANWKENNY